MLAYYGTKISPHMTDTPEGYLICHDVAIARTGDMVYRAAELQLEGDPDRAVTVRRHPEDVFDPAAVASFEGKDVTAGHPAESVGPSNYAAYSKGHVQNVRRSGDMLVADLLVKDAGLISDIRNGVVREVSLLTGQLKVNLLANTDGALTTYNKQEVRVLRDAPGKGEARQGGKKDAAKETPREENL